MSFISPIYFLALIGIIPILIMYFLKKKHQDIEVSSTYLWQRAVRDIEANTPWQRLRKNVLLILQLLAFAMLVFFLVKPYLISETLNVDNLIVVLDNSLSMSTIEESESRFEKSKKDIEKIIKNLEKGTAVTLIKLGRTPDVIINEAEDKAILLSKLREIGITNEADNPEDTISLVKAMTKNMESYRVILYTDKNINMDNTILKNMGSPHGNLAIENLLCKKEKDSIEALVHIENYGNDDLKTDLIIYSGNEIYDVQEIAIGANESKEIYIEGIPNTNIVRTELDTEDALSADNVRYAVVNNSEPKRVLITTLGNIFLEKAVSLNENIELYKTNEALLDINGYDLYIYDGILPEKLPKDGNVFILNPTNVDKIIKVKGMMKEGIFSTIEDELLEYVDLDISMSRVKTFDPPSWAKPFMFSDDEIIGFKGQNGNQRFVVLGFDIHDTDFPLRYGFPIFIQNVLDYTLSFDMQKSISVFSGEGIDIDVSPKAREVYIRLPSREKLKIGPPFPVNVFTDTNEAGVYTIEQKIDETVNFTYFVSNVNTIKESNINQSFDTDIQPEFKNNIKEKTVKNFKNIFLVFALLILAVEWVVYNRGY